VISENCLSTLETDCEATACRWRCAIEVIDELLSQNSLITGDDADDLLDLRWTLIQADDAEGTIRLFCAVRRRMEHRHYLAFFRIRRWLENHLVARVVLSAQAGEKPVRLKLDHYCVEAIRRWALCVALQTGGEIDRPRLRFCFRQTQLGQAARQRVEASMEPALQPVANARS
jgi:hypothetical protein